MAGTVAKWSPAKHPRDQRGRFRGGGRSGGRRRGGQRTYSAHFGRTAQGHVAVLGVKASSYTAQLTLHTHPQARAKRITR